MDLFYGEKYSKCYVTLEDGKTYGASVVWRYRFRFINLKNK